MEMPFPNQRLAGLFVHGALLLCLLVTGSSASAQQPSSQSSSSSSTLSTPPGEMSAVRYGAQPPSHEMDPSEKSFSAARALYEKQLAEYRAMIEKANAGSSSSGSSSSASSVPGKTPQAAGSSSSKGQAKNSKPGGKKDPKGAASSRPAVEEGETLKKF
jgi:hypothetical protein